MRVVLTNFIGLTDGSLPSIKAPLIDNKFSFKIYHTTSRFEIRADVIVDANANVLVFENFTNGELPSIDEFVVRQTFEDYRPYVEIYCPNKKCGLMYHLWGGQIKLKKVASVSGAWIIEPFNLVLEGVKVKHYIVHNIVGEKKTCIYSVRNPSARPIETARMDFSSFNKDRLTNRIQTIVTFS